MKRTGFRLLAASSVLFVSMASAATRPHYGGTLHVAMRAAPTSMNPNQPGWMELRNLLGLMFETLVTLDQQGRPQPGLAISWQAESGNQRWQFTLRQGVTFSDGTPANAEAMAASLRAANSGWKVSANGDSVVIERDAPAPALLAELALARNSVVKADGGRILGTGPFVVSQWDPGKKLALKARDDYWNGRPFLDSIEVELGKNLREQAVYFDLGKTQVVEIAPEQARQAANEGRRMESSAPLELIALVFSREPQTPGEKKLRDALSLCIDRKQLNQVVLQEGGEPAGGLLPDWMTGYGFLFPADADLTRAQQERAEVPQAILWNLGFEANDPVQRLIAERVVLNAHDAGLRMQFATSRAADVRLVRVEVASLDAHVAFAEVADGMGLLQTAFGSGSLEELYAAESALLHAERVIPLLHLRSAHAVSTNVRGWNESRDGEWRLADVYLAVEKP